MSGAEADVEHPVGLVEHDVADLVERQRAAVQVVEHAAGRADDEVAAARQPAGAAAACRCRHRPARTRKLRLGASLSASLATWSASSRVGVMTRPIGPFSLCGRQRLRNGSRNAAVLPVPVWAWPITSLPASAGGNRRLLESASGGCSPSAPKRRERRG